MGNTVAEGIFVLGAQLVFISIEFVGLEIYRYKPDWYIISLQSYHFTVLRGPARAAAGFLQASHSGWKAQEVLRQQRPRELAWEQVF